MTNKYNPNDLLLNRDDQKYVKRQREAFYIALPQLYPSCEVRINDKYLLLGDEELFLNDNLVAIRDEILASLKDDSDSQGLAAFDNMTEQDMVDMVEHAYKQLDTFLKFDYIGWVTSLLYTQGQDRTKVLADLTMQRSEVRKQRNWVRPL